MINNYGKICIGFNNSDIPSFIRLELKDGMLFKKSKPLDEYSFLDTRICAVWDFISELDCLSNCDIFVDENGNVYSIGHKEIPEIPNSKTFKFNKKDVGLYDRIIIKETGKYYNKEKQKTKDRSKELNQIMVGGFLNDLSNIEEDYCLTLAKEGRKNESILELFVFNSKSFIDISMFKDYVVQFDLERLDNYKHFIHHCINTSNKKELIKHEIRLHFTPISKGFRYFDKRMCTRSDIK